ncbi:MAG: threonylcarbamoyl-AMP synthase [Saprospiraceae bacterium]|nr:threonylcarbamoyl-AMP synthase [Saprospiraceae bacterium]
MFLEIHPDNPDQRQIELIVKTLNEGGIIIYPTDTVYALGCSIDQKQAIEKLCALKKIDPDKALLTFICSDISQVASYARPIDTTIYRVMKRNLPGPFTFILEANNEVPRLIKGRKKTIGIRIPDNKVVQSIVEALGKPMLSASLKSYDDIQEYYTNAFDIYEEYQHQVDIVIDGGLGHLDASTIVDCSENELNIIRQGVKELI